MEGRGLCVAGPSFCRRVLLAWGVALAAVLGSAPCRAQSAGDGTPAAALRRALEIKALRGRDGALDTAVSLLASVRARLPRHDAMRVIAELEELDLLLRLRRETGVEERLRRLEADWRDVPSILARVRALRRLLQLEHSLLLEPNAVASVEVGAAFAERFLVRPRPGAPAREIPREFPIRFLSGLAEGVLSSRKTAAGRPAAVVIGFVEESALAEPELDVAGKVAALLDRDRGVLVALMVYSDLAPAGTPGDAGPGAAPAAEEDPASGDGSAIDIHLSPWDRAAVLRFRGSFRRFAGLPRRTRVEWIPGPAFFLVGAGGTVASWWMPWDDWRGFELDLADHLRVAGSRRRS